MLGSQTKQLRRLSYVACLLIAACGGDVAPDAEAETTGTPSTSDAKSPAARPLAGGELTAGFAPIAFDLAGTSWIVIAIDGQPLVERYADLATIHFTHAMLYWQGCNQHEGLYVRTETSFAVGSAMMTTAACPAESPDAVMATVLGNRPLIAGNAEGKVMLAVNGHSLTLSQIDARYQDHAPPPLGMAPFRLQADEGGMRPPVLSLQNGRFSVWIDCAGAIAGEATIRDGVMRTASVQTRNCPTHRPTATRALARFLEASPRIARSPDGELLLSDGDTVIHGRQCHPDSSGCAHALTENEGGA